MYEFRRWIAILIDAIIHMTSIAIPSGLLTAITIGVQGGQRHVANAALALTSKPLFVFDRPASLSLNHR